MNGAIKQDRSDHTTAPGADEEEKAPKETPASAVRDGPKLQPPPFAERKNGVSDGMILRFNGSGYSWSQYFWVSLKCSCHT
ncbi:hypothetical protein WISP_127188 [Willisornis vidua]|uniref:Uncharacterized protein n=1 Tax=Willisornis vidua TaxID=1566151 RepID=A0ABQ9CWN4_9PASS|nr:hypothetical protein WISP_127188 [Willisornis vidua]